MGTMTPEERRFLDAYRDRNNECLIPSHAPFSEVAGMEIPTLPARLHMACVASVDECGRDELTISKRAGVGQEYDCSLYHRSRLLLLGEHGWFDKRFMYEESLYADGDALAGTYQTGYASYRSTQNIDSLPYFP